MRVALQRDKNTSIQLGKIGKVVLHVIPMPSFADGRMADIVSELHKGSHVPVPLDELGLPSGYSVNLDGYLAFSQAPPTTRLSYVQFFRNGAIEGVGELRSDDKITSRFISRDLTNVVVSRVRQYLDVLNAYDLGLPVGVSPAVIFTSRSACHERTCSRMSVISVNRWRSC
jgi:hypothetical protein